MGSSTLQDFGNGTPQDDPREIRFNEREPYRDNRDVRSGCDRGEPDRRDARVRRIQRHVARQSRWQSLPDGALAGSLRDDGHLGDSLLHVHGGSDPKVAFGARTVVDWMSSPVLTASQVRGMGRLAGQPGRRHGDRL